MGNCWRKYTNVLIWGGREACRDNIIQGILRFYLTVYYVCVFFFATCFRISHSIILLELCTELYLQPQQTHCILGSDVAFLEITCQHFRGNCRLSPQSRQFIHRPIYHTTRRHFSEGSDIYSYMAPVSHTAVTVTLNTKCWNKPAPADCAKLRPYVRARVLHLNGLQDPVSRWNQFKRCW
jgi:hypothetical protein